MDLLLRSALPLSVNLNRYATKVATHIHFPVQYQYDGVFTTVKLHLNHILNLAESLRTFPGWFERTFVFSGIQFTKQLIEFVFVETIVVVRSNSNAILVAKLRPALEQNCGKQTPSANILFSRTNLVCVLHINV